MSENNQKSITQFFKSNQNLPANQLLQQKSAESQEPIDNIKINDDKPFHPLADYVFPKSKSGDKLRSCQANWFTKFPWLHYDEK